MPDSFSLLESFTSNASGFRFFFWDHRKHQVSTQLIYLYEFKHPVVLDNLESKKWFDLSRNPTIFRAVQSYFQKRTLVAYASSQGKTQTSVRRMDKLLWLILVLFWIFFLSFFVSWRLCCKDFFLCFNIYSVGVLNSTCCIKKKSGCGYNCPVNHMMRLQIFTTHILMKTKDYKQTKWFFFHQ